MIGGMTSLIIFGTDDHGPTITLGPDVEHVEVHPDLSVTVVGPVPPYPGARYPTRVTSTADGTATLTCRDGKRYEVLTARAYLGAAERQGVPIRTIL